MTWTLTKITPNQFDEIYAGTEVMKIKHLFEKVPESFSDAVENFLPSKLWRMNSGIYWIEDKLGKLIQFEMNFAQHMIYAAYLRHPRLIILKSRQQGISTLWLIFFFDEAITKDNQKFGLMSQGLKESSALKRKVETAYDNLPSEIIDLLNLGIVKRNTQEFELINDSIIHISTSFRSGTLQGLHISEFGKIANKQPEKAKETRTGSMQAIRGGLPVIIESTAEGRQNMFAEMWEQAITHQGSRSPKDFYPVFLSWVEDPDCQINIPQTITKEAGEYFEKLKVEYEKFTGKELKLSDEQRWWWVSQLREFGYSMEMMGQEYPGYPDEAFSASKDGTYYSKLYREHVVNKGHILPDIFDRNLPVDVAIDLGMNDSMNLVYFQVFNKELRFIDEYHNSGEGILHYVNQMKSTGYRIRTVWLPHDAKVRELGTGKSRLEIFRSLGLSCRLIKRTNKIQNDIELVRKIIPQMYFDEKNTIYLQQTMENYTKEWDSRLGIFKDRPLHNEWSNPADAIRYAVIAVYHKVKEEESQTTVRSRSNVVDGLSL